MSMIEATNDESVIY